MNGPVRRYARICGFAVLYGGVAVATLVVAFGLRFDFAVPSKYQQQLLLALVWVIPLQVVFYAIGGQFSGLAGFFSLPELRRLAQSSLLTVGVLLVSYYAIGPDYSLPRGIILTHAVLSFTAIAAVRLGLRILHERRAGLHGIRRQRRIKVAIVGAGDAGALLAKEMIAHPAQGYDPILFLDDDPQKWGSYIHGLPIIGPPERLGNETVRNAVNEVVLAIPSAPPRRIREIVAALRTAGLKHETVPSLSQLASGKVRVTSLRPVELEDLLGRDVAQVPADRVAKLLADRVVAVTGAGGSIGAELCRQIASFNPKRLLLIEQSEVQIFQIEQELVASGYRGTILPLVADILDQPRMRFVFERFRPELIFHAAAHKHVPMMESQPGEAIKNNSLGTAKLAELALAAGVDRFVLISTDKAINPTNVMGASKRLAEMYVQALHAANPGKTKFMAVRFGNVLGSSGSVIPTFKKQIEAGGPVTVTHADVTRYFMTIPEAAGLVLQSAALGEGGEIFVLDMGEPVKIADLARQVIELSGLRPDEDIEIKFTGLRPGEKLFEEITHDGENFKPTDHPKIMRFVTMPPPIEAMRATLDGLIGQVHAAEPNQLKLEIQKAVPEYKPYLT